MPNGLTYKNNYNDCKTLKDGSGQYFLFFFFDNTELKSFIIVVRSAKANNYAENIKYHLFL